MPASRLMTEGERVQMANTLDLELFRLACRARSWHQFARMLGVSPRTLRGWLRGEHRIGEHSRLALEGLLCRVAHSYRPADDGAFGPGGRGGREQGSTTATRTSRLRQAGTAR